MEKKKYEHGRRIHFTRGRNIMQDRWSRGEELRMKMTFFCFFFSVSFFGLVSKSILKQQHAENTAKSNETDVLELIKLQNILHSLPLLAQS